LKLLGIDPAPSKQSVVFDGEQFFSLEPFALKPFLEDVVDNNTFISWDAPLGDDFSASLSYKPIEKILNTKNSYIDGKKPPRGISTLPFASCPHWSISQYVLGYPIVNNELINKEKLKYRLVQSNDDTTKEKPNLFETHPAYSLWVFLKDDLENFKYKGSKESKLIFEQIKEILFEKEVFKKYSYIKNYIDNDDKLDSFLAYVNLELFLEKRAFVYGSATMGAMLLPLLDGVLKKKVLKNMLN